MIVRVDERELGVYVTVQDPDTNEQDEVVNRPPAPLSLHVTVPVGTFAELVISDTDEVNVIGTPEGMMAGFGVTAVAVLSKVIVGIVTTDVPLLVT